MRHLVRFSFGLLVFVLMVFVGGTSVPRVSAVDPIDNLAIDVDTTGNTSTSNAFPVDTCVEVSTSASQDIDMVIGPGGIPGPEGLLTFSLRLLYNPSIVHVTARTAILLIGADGNYNEVQAGSEAVPSSDGN